jgi:hypothetical protein
MKKIVSSILLLIIASAAVFAQSQAPMLFRQPTMNQTDIVFVFAGDLWSFPRRRGCRTLDQRNGE